MTPKQRRALERAREEFARATEGMTEEEISDRIQQIVREIRQERAAMRQEIELYRTTNTASFTELDVFYDGTAR